MTHLTCPHCGHSGPDVQNFTVWVGGSYQTYPACINIAACWRRWEEQAKEKREAVAT